MRQAKSQWRPSSREMSSFENVRPGMSPRFLSQKMAAKEPEKKIPSTAAKATTRTEYGASEPIHFKAHSAKIIWVKYESGEFRKFSNFRFLGGMTRING